MSNELLLRTEAAGPEHARGLIALFEATGCVCYCRYWHFLASNNDWLERCSSNPQHNRHDFDRALASKSDEARGIVAFSEKDELIGWLKVAPANAMQKVYERRLYKGLPCFDGNRSAVFVIGCVLVHPKHRRLGIGSSLVKAAVHIASSWGARALEAFPRRPNGPVADEELWMGPLRAFEENGFVVVNAFEPYPVLRREL